MNTHELLHAAIHEAQHDPEDTVVVALTRRDYVLVVACLALYNDTWACTQEELVDLFNRLKELRQAQKPEWEQGADE